MRRRDRYGDRASGLALLGAGGWSRAYALTLDGQPAVARFGAYGAYFAKDQIMARFSTPGPPIPAVTELGRTAHGYFAVSARAFGMLLDDLDEAGLRAGPAQPAIGTGCHPRRRHRRQRRIRDLGA